MIKGYIPIIFIGILTLGSLLPGETLNYRPLEGRYPLDKIIHVLMYFVMMISISFAIKANEIYNKNYIILSGILLFVYSIVLEGIQEWLIPGRSFELMDIIANFIGTLLGYITFLVMIKKTDYGN